MTLRDLKFLNPFQFPSLSFRFRVPNALVASQTAMFFVALCATFSMTGLAWAETGVTEVQAKECQEMATSRN